MSTPNVMESLNYCTFEDFQKVLHLKGSTNVLLFCYFIYFYHSLGNKRTAAELPPLSLSLSVPCACVSNPL